MYSAVVFIEKKTCISEPPQLKFMLFKGQLYLLNLGIVLIENGIYISIYSFFLNWNHETKTYEN